MENEKIVILIMLGALSVIISLGSYIIALVGEKNKTPLFQMLLYIPGINIVWLFLLIPVSISRDLLWEINKKKNF